MGSSVAPLSSFALRVCAVRGDSAEFELDLDADYPGFCGHFPGRPVLPGACHLIVAMSGVSRMLGRQASLASVVRAKFLRVVGPGSRLAIRLTLERLPARLHRVEVVHTVESAAAARMTLLVA